MLIILDNGHGKETPGKRSPKWEDGSQLFEYEFNRDITKRIQNRLTELNIESVLLVPEEEDVSLGERCRRANEIFKKRPDSILISIHANAGGGTGWEAWTSIGSTLADKYATILYTTATEWFPEWKIRTDYTDGDPDKESQFYILKHTKCPAVLTENFFMDTKKDCDFILSNTGRERIANMHVAAILKF